MFNNFIQKGTVYVIGDVHGCAKEFEALLKKIKDTSPDARIYQLGDLIDRGPYFYEVFELCDQYDVVSLIGNHEMRFYAESLFGDKCRSNARLESHKKIKELSDKDRQVVWERIANSPRYVKFVLDETNTSFTLSHSPMKKNTFVTPDCSAILTCSTNDTTGLAWNNIYGHMAWDYKDVRDILETRDGGDPINIDSGCVYGNCLTALCLNDMSIIQEPSRKTYANMRKL